MSTQTFRARIAANDFTPGHFIMEFPTPGIGILAERAGADWILYDLEHSGYTLEGIRPALTVSRGLELASFVRVPGPQQHLVTTALDAGAEGIMMPYVNTAEQAELIGTWLRYPPLGIRGSAFGQPTERFAATDPAGKQAESNASVVFLPQIETPEAVANAAAIAAVDAVTVPFVGPLDLSTNLGAPGDFTTPEFREALGEVARAARAAGKPAGIFSINAALTRLALELGYTVVSLSADSAVYQQALAGAIAEARGLA